MPAFIEQIRELKTAKKEVAVAALLGLALYISSAMMFFGMNFWLWSFTKGLKRSYTTIFVPSVGWAILFGISTPTVFAFQWYHGKREPFFFWVCRQGVVLLFLIGLFDSLTGLFAMYAAVHVPVILQSALISTGPIWTYIFAQILYPESQPPFSPVLLLAVAFTVGGVALALVPQIQSHKKTEFFNPGWIAVFLVATASFPLYNVLQGRFLNRFASCCTPFTTKMVMLTMETIVQLALTIMYFPLDAVPVFGKTDSLQESWDMFIQSLQCIGTCSNNAKYMVLYVTGFWIRHIIFACLNSYSPTVAAVASQLTQPINTFLLLLIPSWNVYGAPAVWYYTLGCFLCLLASMTIFVVWHLVNTRRHHSVSTGSLVMESAPDDIDEDVEVASSVKV